MLVVGVDSLLTQLARCCKPAPPDDIRGYITRGKGVSIHRSDCADFSHLARQHPGRVIDVQRSAAKGKGPNQPSIRSTSRSRRRTARACCATSRTPSRARRSTSSESRRRRSGGVAWMTFTVEVPDAMRVARDVGCPDVPGACAAAH